MNHFYELDGDAYLVDRRFKYDLYGPIAGQEPGLDKYAW